MQIAIGDLHNFLFDNGGFAGLYKPWLAGCFRL